MNIESAVMKVPFGEAHRQFRAYQGIVKERPQHATKDDVTLYRALWQITQGQKVIDIQKAIESGGVNEVGLPRLAIGRANAQGVYCWHEGDRFYFTARKRFWRSKGKERQKRQSISIAMPHGNHRDLSGYAHAPLVPAEHRPKGSLAGYHLLWEAEWQRVVPVDPILLRRISGPFFVVLAQWELTPLEQAVLRQRL